MLIIFLIVLIVYRFLSSVNQFIFSIHCFLKRTRHQGQYITNVTPPLSPDYWRMTLIKDLLLHIEPALCHTVMKIQSYHIILRLTPRHSYRNWCLKVSILLDRFWGHRVDLAWPCKTCSCVTTQFVHSDWMIPGLKPCDWFNIVANLHRNCPVF